MCDLMNKLHQEMLNATTLLRYCGEQLRSWSAGQGRRSMSLYVYTHINIKLVFIHTAYETPQRNAHSHTHIIYSKGGRTGKHARNRGLM